MKKETRREIQRLMALLLGLSLCIASMTYGYAGDTEDLGKTIEDGQTSKGAGQEAVDEAKEKLQEGMESLRDTVCEAAKKAQDVLSAVKDRVVEGPLPEDAIELSPSQEGDSEEQGSIIEVSDLNSLRKAVDLVEEDTEVFGEQGSIWQSKRLLVQSDSEFDTMGAKSVICGYGNVFILDFASEKETEEAYGQLRKLKGVVVETDSAYCGIAADMDQMHLQGQFDKTAVQASMGQRVCVAVLDTGYDTKYYGRERIWGSTDISSENTVEDGHGHGTAMANIILDHTPGGVQVMPVKVADENGRTSSLKLYLGIRYATENGADIINISMGAPQASASNLVSEAISQARQAGIATVVSAGNAGQDVSSFSPADAKDAIAVAAVNTDKGRMGYSNYGEGVDYCSYGKLKAFGLNGDYSKYSGTSVSAAIVSAMAAKWKALCGGVYEELVAWLDGQAEDLGEPGRDIYFGKGLLAPEGLNALEDADNPEGLPALLTCDWKQIPDAALNELISETDELVVRRFLDQRSKEERSEILKRAPVLQNDHVELVCGIDGTSQYRNVETLFQYLYSDRFEAYYVQKKINGTYYMYIQNAAKKVYLTTDKNASKCTLQVKFSGTKTNPADNPTITVSGTSAGAFDLANAKLDGIKTFTDDSGHANTIGQVGITGIQIKKRAHSKITGQKKAIALKENHGSDLWSGGFVGFGDNKCVDTASAGCKLMVGVGDLELNKDGKTQTYQATITEYAPSGWGAWTDWTVQKDAFCFQAGIKQHTHTKECSNCGKTVDTETKAREIPQLSHDFTNAPWNYKENNHRINGERWVQCNYGCGAAEASSGYDARQEFWKKDYQYLQQIYYRYMDANGKYPDYIAFVDGYFSAGTQIPGCSYAQTEYSEHKDTPGIVSYTVSDKANTVYIDIPRKKYRILYDGNGADYGTVLPQEVYCGQVFDLSKSSFRRVGYEFAGWSRTPDGDTIGNKACKNLSYTDGDEVILYAKWKPARICISLDSQGANLTPGTGVVFERYASGYFKNQELTSRFAGNRIQIPQKQRIDPSLPGGMRRQQFLGYFTEKDKRGYPFVLKDGLLMANINGKPAYTYFKEDSTVYACWQDMYAIRFDPNLSEYDMEVLGKKTSVLCPAIRWAGQREDVTVSNGDAIIQNSQFADIYRFLGWSLTPKISSADEIILNKEMPAYTFHVQKDITLYAQWDTSYTVAYIGNGQSSGADYLETQGHITDIYTFATNDETENGAKFTKTAEKPAMDVATGQMQDDAGAPFTEQVKYRFLGWSMEPQKNGMAGHGIYTADTSGIAGSELILKAKEAAEKGAGEGVLFGCLPSGYGLHSTPRPLKEGLADKKMPVIALYAVWDQYPQIFAADMYFPLADAQNGVLTEGYLLNRVKATDYELISGANTEGMLKPGIDADNNTSFSIIDYQAEEFTSATQEMNFTLTFRAKDAAGNISMKMVHVYLVDTSQKEQETGKVRFISGKYADTLVQDSVWRSGTYAKTLAYVLGNKKTGEEYTEVTPLQQLFGMKPVKKPGSGVWTHVQEVWQFTHEQVLTIQDYVKTVGAGGDTSGFIGRFGHCRVQ